MLQKIGMMVTVFGAMMADSASLLIPLGVIAIGAILFLVGKWGEMNG